MSNETAARRPRLVAERLDPLPVALAVAALGRLTEVGIFLARPEAVDVCLSRGRQLPDGHDRNDAVRLEMSRRLQSIPYAGRR